MRNQDLHAPLMAAPAPPPQMLYRGSRQLVNGEPPLRKEKVRPKFFHFCSLRCVLKMSGRTSGSDDADAPTKWATTITLFQNLVDSSKVDESNASSDTSRYVMLSWVCDCYLSGD